MRNQLICSRQWCGNPVLFARISSLCQVNTPRHFCFQSRKINSNQASNYQVICLQIPTTSALFASATCTVSLWLSQMYDFKASGRAHVIKVIWSYQDFYEAKHARLFFKRRAREGRGEIRMWIENILSVPVSHSLKRSPGKSWGGYVCAAFKHIHTERKRSRLLASETEAFWWTTQSHRARFNCQSA